MEPKRKRGRPKSTDPKVKPKNIYLKRSTILDIEIVAEELGISKSELFRDIIEKELEKYKDDPKKYETYIKEQINKPKK